MYVGEGDQQSPQPTNRQNMLLHRTQYIIPLLAKTPLVLILLRIAIEQKKSTLGGTNPFHTPLKEMHELG